MPPRAVKKGNPAEVKEEAVVEQEEDIPRPPDGSGDEDDLHKHESSSDEDSFHNIDIAPQTFGPKKEKAADPNKKNSLPAAGMNKGMNETSTRSRRGWISPTSSQASNSSTKRKLKEESKLPASMNTDMFGRLIINKKRQKYTYSKTNQGKVNKTAPRLGSDDGSPKKEFKTSHIHESPHKSDAEEKEGFKIPNTSHTSSSITSPVSEKKFKLAVVALSPDKEDRSRKPDDKINALDDDCSPTQTQRPGFISYEIVGSDPLIETAQSLLETPRYQIPTLPAPFIEDDFDLTMTQIAKCPMCGKAVDPEDLREYSKKGYMNTRKQEKFCLTHQRKTAQDEWELNSYPTIDWNRLDSRISKHHAFIKQLINGANCHYRKLLAESVDAGKNRSLMKSDFNPTPGYYGTRGKRAISENTMRKFTPLLKKRIVVDTLMAARGFTPYVEYVVVPEVAVKLIMEDMRVDAEQAREIMGTSIGLGELLSEEIRDVVTRGRDEDSNV